MERQTRTKKYSDLRNQLENNNETEGKTAALAGYQEKLEQVEANLNPLNEKLEAEKALVEEAPVKEEIKVEEAVVESDNNNLSSKEEENAEESEDLLDLLDLVSEEGSKEDPKEEDIKKEEIVSPEPLILEEEPVSPAPSTEEVKVQEETPETDVNGDEYLKKCLDEVNEYNKAQGLMTSDDVPNKILSEVRGQSTVQEEVKEDQNDLNDTVTMEISKILDSMDEEEAAKESEEFKETPIGKVDEEAKKAATDELEKLFETAGISKEAAELLRPYLKNDDVSKAIEESEVHETIAKTLEAEDIQEPLSEEVQIEEEIAKTKVDLLVAKDDEPTHEDLLNDTIPFVVDTQEIVADEEDEEEDSTPNKVLNIILIVLIVVLIAVLGVIIYWILMAQGIL